MTADGRRGILTPMDNIEHIKIQLLHLRTMCDNVLEDLNNVPSGTLPFENVTRGRGIILNGNTMQVWFKDQKIQLAVKQFAALEVLVSRPNVVRSRAEIMEYLYPPNSYPESDRIVDTLIKKLRREFKKHDPEFSQIRTIYGIGYIWET